VDGCIYVVLLKVRHT